MTKNGPPESERARVVRFGELLHGGTRNGVYKPKELHGRGTKIVNMGELFAHPRLPAVPMKRLELTGEEIERFRIRPGDLLFARRSLVAEGAGRCTIVREVDEPTVFESSIIRARPDPARADSLFLYYLFASPGGAHLRDTIRRDASIAGITGTDLARLTIEIPSLERQRSIAHVLGTLDDKVELNRRTIETLDAIARALFESWFVDFDPVRAKSEGRDPSGVDAETASLFPSELVGSGLGPVPKGWTVLALDEIADFRNGLALQKFRPAPGEPRLPAVKIAQLRTGQPDSGEWARADIAPDCILDDGDVVFSWSGSLTVVVWCGGRAALNQHLFRVTSSRYPKWFYWQWLLRHLPEFQRIAGFKATTMGHIQRHHLTAAKCVVPPDAVLQAATRVFAPLLDRQVALDMESRGLSRLRDELLSRLIRAVPPVESAGGEPA